MGKRAFPGVLVLAVFCAAGCGGRDKGYDLCIFNGRADLAPGFEALAGMYGGETGLRVRVRSAVAGGDPMAELRGELEGREGPAIFSVHGVRELAEWREGGFVLNLNQVRDGAFSVLAASVPPALRLCAGGAANYGIPCNVEGCGYIVDTRLLGDIFGPENVPALLEDIRIADYEEWEALVRTLDRWIRSPSRAWVELNGRSYRCAPAKYGLAENLTGVFTAAASEKREEGEQLVNVALNAIFNSSYEACGAADETIRSGRNAFVAYARTLDLMTSYLAGRTGPVRRGKRFLTPEGFDDSQVTRLFAGSKGIFLMEDSGAYGAISALNRAQGERLAFLPVKMPFRAADIVRSDGMTAAKLNRSIPVFSSYYFVVNRRASEAERRRAYDFLVWLITAPGAQRFLEERCGFIPYNGDLQNAVFGNTLGNSLAGYLKAGDITSVPCRGIPPAWAEETIGLQIGRKYLVKAGWTEADYWDIADMAINGWLALRRKGLEREDFSRTRMPGGVPDGWSRGLPPGP